MNADARVQNIPTSYIGFAVRTSRMYSIKSFIPEPLLLSQ